MMTAIEKRARRGVRRVSAVSAALRETFDKGGRLSEEGLTRSHGGTESLLKRRGEGVSLFVNRRAVSRTRRFVVARSAEALCEKFINTERPTAGRQEVSGSLASRLPVALVAPSDCLGFTQSAQRGRDAKSAKTPKASCRASLCDLCVRTFAAFALKENAGRKECSHGTRSHSPATLPLPREAALCLAENVQIRPTNLFFNPAKRTIDFLSTHNKTQQKQGDSP